MILDTIIKNLCCAAITGATNNLFDGFSWGSKPEPHCLFQSVDALVHITPHPLLSLWRALACSGVHWRALACSGVLWRALSCSVVLCRELACTGVLWLALLCRTQVLDNRTPLPDKRTKIT